MSFVGYNNIYSVDELKELLTQNANSNSYYFLRWVDKVSGIVEELPSDFEQNPSPEGQMFNSKLELRWKRKGSGFEVLLLTESDSLPKFLAVENDCEWETEVRDAYLYQPTVTRFPNRFKYPDNFKIAQRYFKNKTTSTVHFIALTIQEKQ
ncbi:hypothetical protein VB834_09905 [Limnoraphis robusta Tam1]|uniref:hypothetical protein n=1 Tax=Limnoraphis robusta TaxID=1118279 RepID=UPI002B217E47|nr:hypothetical protein [Limnoraphis robusta]MEA5499050.1 hypothetical protein [Limnoraphis robusta BA-68 BA1]MEA5539347.1 hypothetical protein [Limnoraphis robusta Tam1]